MPFRVPAWTAVPAVAVALSIAAPASGQFNLYYGNFHAHCNLSNDATGPDSGPPDEAFQYARDVAGIDVLALTDHSHYLTTSEYNQLQSEANNFTQNGTFVAIAAQEFGNLSNSTVGAFGHMNVYESPGLVPDSFRENLPGTYGWISSHVDDTIFAPLVASFNHPYSSAGQGMWAQFQDFTYDATGDDAVQFLEVLNGKRTSSYEPEYLDALTKGWHVGALGNQDNHQGSWGDQVNNAGNIPLTGIWARGLTKADILQALAARRTFAMEVDPVGDRMSLKVTANGNWMGSEFTTSADSVEFVVEVSAVTNIASISLFRNGVLIRSTGVGAPAFTWNTFDTPGPGDFYYVVRISQSDGDRAWASPIWVESTSTFSQPISVINEDNPDGTPTLWFQTATVQGIVTVDSDTLATGENRFFIQDDTGGLMILDFDSPSEKVALGENVLISGLVNQEKGQTFLDPNPGAITIQSQGEPPAPLVLTTSQIAGQGEDFEGELVELVDVSIVAGSWPLPGNEGSVTIDDGSGPCELFIDRDTSVDDAGPPADPSFTVRGLLMQDDSTPPHDCCYRVVPRWAPDVFPNIGVGVEELPSHVAYRRSRLLQNAPNPFRPQTRVRFELAGASEQPVRLAVYDVNGRLVRSLIEARMPPGAYEVTWDGRTEDGARAAAGVYFYRLFTRDAEETRKMVLLN